MANEADALRRLIQILDTPVSAALRVAAIEGLGAAGGDVARAALIRVLDQPASVEVHAAAARALGRATHR